MQSIGISFVGLTIKPLLTKWGVFYGESCGGVCEEVEWGLDGN